MPDKQQRLVDLSNLQRTIPPLRIAIPSWVRLSWSWHCRLKYWMCAKIWRKLRKVVILPDLLIGAWNDDVFLSARYSVSSLLQMSVLWVSIICWKSLHFDRDADTIAHAISVEVDGIGKTDPKKRAAPAIVWWVNTPEKEMLFRLNLSTPRVSAQYNSVEYL